MASTSGSRVKRGTMRVAECRSMNDKMHTVGIPKSSEYLAIAHALVGLPSPSSVPCRVDVPIEMPRGTMKKRGITLYATACAASATGPSRPATNAAASQYHHSVIDTTPDPPSQRNSFRAFGCSAAAMSTPCHVAGSYVPSKKKSHSGDGLAGWLYVMCSPESMQSVVNDSVVATAAPMMPRPIHVMHSHSRNGCHTTAVKPVM
mmetsp:Transcript_24718/g.64399  ORF Transcript_24718/g.64399 Transcript_24718/m.64399 type:complete len:204 (+) Transcript_24718:482-1093(+)